MTWIKQHNVANDFSRVSWLMLLKLVGSICLAWKFQCAYGKEIVHVGVLLPFCYEKLTQTHYKKHFQIVKTLNY